MRDTLPTKHHKNECGVINLDSNVGPGTHWTCYYIRNNKKYYFDSYGLDPPTELQNYLGKSVVCSTFQIQDIGTSICGHLCVFVLSRLTSGEDFYSIIFSLL